MAKVILSNEINYYMNQCNISQFLVVEYHSYFNCLTVFMILCSRIATGKPEVWPEIHMLAYTAALLPCASHSSCSQAVRCTCTFQNYHPHTNIIWLAPPKKLTKVWGSNPSSVYILELSLMAMAIIKDSSLQQQVPRFTKMLETQPR